MTSHCFTMHTFVGLQHSHHCGSQNQALYADAYLHLAFYWRSGASKDSVANVVDFAPPGAAQRSEEWQCASFQRL